MRKKNFDEYTTPSVDVINIINEQVFAQSGDSGLFDADHEGFEY